MLILNTAKKYENLHAEKSLTKGGKTGKAFSLAWLEAYWYFSEGTGTTHKKRVQERLCIAAYSSTVQNSRVLLLLTGTGQELPGYP
jgi:hypothetical protein